MVKPPTRSRCMQHTVYSPPRYYSRPDDGPVIGPKHVVLSINTTPHYTSCVQLYYPCTFILITGNISEKEIKNMDKLSLIVDITL